jgi:K+-sensing histidine kinase KdpD
MRTMQTSLADHWYNRRTSLEQVLRKAQHRLASVVAVAIAPLLCGSCAELTEYRTDITQLRSDLQANTQLLTQLSARVDALDGRQAATESTARQMQQELSQAIEVLLKRALVKENRQITRESGKTQAKETEMLERQARPLPSETQRASSPGAKHLSLGMTQEDVRRTFGDPISIEHAGAYIFWQYSQMSNQKYVVFEKASGQVSGWRGL